MKEILKKMSLEFLGTGQHKMSIEQLFEIKDVVFLDVREPEEVNVLTFNLDIFGIKTVNIPIKNLTERISEIPTDKTIACFCSSGTRAAWAYNLLLSEGYNAKWLDTSNEGLAELLKPGKVLKAIK